MEQFSEVRNPNAESEPSTAARRATLFVRGFDAAGASEELARVAMQVIVLTREDAYWRAHYSERAYVEEGSSYDDYGPAYAFGVNAFSRNPGASFEAAEPELSKQWIGCSGASMLGWDDARYAARDAWNRLSHKAGLG